MNAVNQNNIAALKELADRVYKRESSPDPGLFSELLADVNNILNTELPAYRPLDSKKHPGGIINLAAERDTVIIPDIHARLDFLLSLIKADFNNRNGLLESIAADQTQLLFLGDIFHAEARAKKRWLAAGREAAAGFTVHRHADIEMAESLSAYELVLGLKRVFPDKVHILKGNHENIKNSSRGGNFPFTKFTRESAITTAWVKKFYGEEIIGAMARVETGLPVLAVGINFMASHAQPRYFLDRKMVLNYRYNEQVTEYLTWTANGDAAEGSVSRMLSHYLPCRELEKTFYFAGHRVVKGLYQTRSAGRFVQIHNPAAFVIAFLCSGNAIKLDRDIMFLPDKSSTTDNSPLHFTRT
ncbi:MAG TPA: calcineurin [Spirochaetota bacterium]|nr:calcineurin [Spirochaetota bacterium]